MTGFAREALVGRSPRLIQGEATNPLVLRTLSRALKDGGGSHGYLANYRWSGEEYLCEIAIRPIVNSDGAVEHFIGFEREVHRRRGRPGAVPGSRYEPVDPRP